MAEALPSVLFVTSELVGPFKNGGLGTATTGLVETVAGMGCPTTVFYTGGIWAETDMSRWIEAYRRIGVEFVAISPASVRHLAGPVSERSVAVPYLVYEFARSRRFDIIHFNDTLGEGMLVVAAKRLGLGWADTLLALAHHGPTRWAFGLNRQPMDRLLHAAFDWAEFLSVRSADLLWGPSRYLIEATRSDGWRLPDQVLLQQYVMPTARLFEPDTAKFAAADAPAPVRTVSPIAEIAFFGRLEERKGLRTFCAALDRLAERLAAAGIAVTFMGRPMPEDGECTEDWIRRAGAAWRFPWRLETGFGQPEAIAYLTSRPLVAVMPSPYDNSPCTVYEAVQHGIPFLAAATGGIPELIAEADHAQVLFEYTVDGLAAALERVLIRGITTARPMIEAAERRRRWEEFHRAWRSHLPAATVSTTSPTRFVVLIDRAARREQALRTLDSVHAVLGDRAARTVVLASGGLGALPGNTEVVDLSRLASPKAVADTLLGPGPPPWLLCLSAGVTLVPEAIPALERALSRPQSGAGLIPGAVVAGAEQSYIVPPVGGTGAFGFFEGYGFTGAAVLSTGAVRAALAGADGLPRTAFAGLPDLLVAAGEVLWPYPEIVVDLSAGWARMPVTFDPARDRAFARVEPVQASMIRWIGAAAVRDMPGTPEKALALFLGGRAGAGLVMRLYRLCRWLRWAVLHPGTAARRIGRRAMWYARHPMHIVRQFDGWPGYAAGRRVYRSLRGEPQL
ncbi:MAG TPA: glycosyltransferase [Stellaceae bacterium]|nr:glycosyltransferase [Stellaceae bacterium]